MTQPPQSTSPNPAVACDAMCGGVARWLRILGIDASFTPGIDDSDLVQHARAERRTIITADNKMLERRCFTTGELTYVRLPVGLPLIDQLHFVVDKLKIAPGFPRCASCNGALHPVARREIGDVVPARSLIWADEFYRCSNCRQVFWEGTHWRRIRAIRNALA